MAAAAQHGYLFDLLRKLGLSDFGASTGEFLLVRPVKVIIIGLFAWSISRVVTKAVRRFVRSLYERTPLSGGATKRAHQRVTTLSDVLAGVARALIWVIASLMMLSVVGLNLAPLLAGAGIAGIAIGFGAQSLVRDFLAGFFILLEDQYGVGDVITIGDATGTVEDVTLRVSRLRSTDGTVFFIPNGEIRRVGNSSMEWSRALIDVVVPWDADTEVVNRVLLDEAGVMAEEPAWQESILEPPELWGVQAMGTEGLTIRLVVKTAPRQQYAVARELRGRISNRLRREGVVLGPRQAVPVSSVAIAPGSPVPPRPTPSA